MRKPSLWILPLLFLGVCGCASLIPAEKPMGDEAKEYGDCSKGSVRVAGAVLRPGRYSWDFGITPDAFMRAAGLKDDAVGSEVLVLRWVPTGSLQRQVIRLKGQPASEFSDELFVLIPRDILYVTPKACYGCQGCADKFYTYRYSLKEMRALVE